MKMHIALLLFVLFAGSVRAESSGDQSVDRSQARERQLEASFNKAQEARQLRFNSKNLSVKTTKSEINFKDKISLKSYEWYQRVKSTFFRWISPVSLYFKGHYKSLTQAKMSPPVVDELSWDRLGNGIQGEIWFFPEGFDGEADHLVWDFGDGTGFTMPAEDFDLDNGGVPHIYSQAGTYEPSLRIYNAQGEYTEVTTELEITDNKLPYPKFSIQNGVGADYLKVTFNSLATDSDSTINRYEYRFGDGSSDVKGTQTSTVHTYPTAGVYNIRFRARDSKTGWGAAKTSIYVAKTPPAGGSAPIPFVGTSSTTGAAPFTLSLDASNSFDVDGAISAYEWQFGDYGVLRSSSKDSQTQHTYSRAGTYYASLKVTDDGGKTAKQYFPVYVTSSQLSGMQPQIIPYPTGDERTIVFDSDAFAMNSLWVDSYMIWDFGDGSDSFKGSYPEHTYDQDGTYLVTLKIYDLSGNLKQVSKNITVDSGMGAPSIQFYADKITTSTNEVISFTTVNSSSVSNDTQILWDFGDGTVVSGLHINNLNPTHAYQTKGLYTVRAVATDIYGISSSYAMTVAVSDMGVLNAVANVNPSIGEVPFPIRLDASASSHQNGQISKYTWAVQMPSGTVDGNGKISNAIIEQNGTSYVSLLIEDTQGNTALAQQSVIGVSSEEIPPTNRPPIARISIGFPDLNDSGYFHFDSGMSEDPDYDQLVKYEWYLDGKILERAAAAYAHVADLGTHEIKLKVYDQWGAEGEAISTFERTNETQSDISVTVSASVVQKGTPIQFTANNVVIPGSTVKRVSWDFGDGNHQCCENTSTHTYTSAGQYTVDFIVIDAAGNAHHKTAPVVVLDALPSFTFDVGPLRPVINDPVTFKISDLTGASDAAISWDFGDGTTACCDLTVLHPYTQAGTYTAKFKIEYSNGLFLAYEKTVVVEEVLPPDVKVTAYQAEYNYQTTSPNQFVIQKLPATVKFDLSSSSGQRELVDAHWDFGDGNTGFGLTPEWIYHKPGTYTINVTGTDSLGQVGTGSITVVVTNDECIVADGVVGCIQMVGGNTNIFKMSESSWQITHDQESGTFTAAPSDSSWVSIADVDSDQDSQEAQVSIGDVVSVSSSNLVIDRDLLAAKSIDLTRPYIMTVSSNLDVSGEEQSYWSQLKEFYFGIGTLNITTNEEGVRLFIQGGRSQYKRYIEMGQSTSIVIGDLPADDYSIVAEKNDRSVLYQAKITGVAPIAVVIDMDEDPSESRGVIHSVKDFISSHISPVKQVRPKLPEGANVKMDDDWVYFSNGVTTKKYPTAKPLTAPDGYEYARPFSMDGGTDNNQDIYFPVTAEYGQKLHVGCNFGTGQQYFSGYSWVVWSTTPSEAYNPAANWASYLADISDHDRSFEIEYQFKDGVTGKVLRKKIKDSPAAIRSRQGFSFDNISETIGIPTSSDSLGYKVIYNEIEIPKTYQRAQVKFKLKSLNRRRTIQGDYDYFQMVCWVQRRINGVPAVEKIESISAPSAAHAPEDNGRRLMDNHLLPVATDLTTSSPHQFAPDIFKAKLRAKIYVGDLGIESINKVEVNFRYAGALVAVNQNLYSIEKVSIPGEDKYFWAYFTLDIANINSHVTYVPDVTKIEMEVKPYDVNGGVTRGTSLIFKPMFNVQALAEKDEVCANGFYSTARISAYAVSEMIEALRKQHSLNSVNLRCNDFSLPWGGLFVIGDWRHKGHRSGKTVDVRYANDQGQQDFYDGDEAKKRIEDVNTYLRYTNVSNLIANNTDYYDMKEAIHLFCVNNPYLAPCKPLLLIEEVDLTFVIKFCLWRQSADNISINGCPSISSSLDYINASKRYSRWVDLNLIQNNYMKSSFLYIISDGIHRQLTPPMGMQIKDNWQHMALEHGLWPDSSPIWKVSGNIVTSDRVFECAENMSCPGAAYAQDVDSHYNHTHYDLK